MFDGIEIRRCDMHDSDTIGIPHASESRKLEWYSDVGRSRRSDQTNTDIVTSKTARDTEGEGEMKRKEEIEDLLPCQEERFRRCRLKN